MQKFIEGFQNPDPIYRPAPLWVWNDEMTKEQIDFQLKLLASHGFGGGHVSALCPDAVTSYAKYTVTTVPRVGFLRMPDLPEDKGDRAFSFLSLKYSFFFQSVSSPTPDFSNRHAKNVLKECGSQTDEPEQDLSKDHQQDHGAG